LLVDIIGLPTVDEFPKAAEALNIRLDLVVRFGTDIIIRCDLDHIFCESGLADQHARQNKNH
jgi:hypothetical protein